MSKIVTDIPRRLDSLSWSRFHTLVVIALGITWILDGLEVTIIGTIGPALGDPRSLGFSSEEIGLVATAYLLGTVAGAVLFSYLTDRQGRKKWFLITLYIYLAATLASALSWNLWSFMLFRFIAGAGIGGEYAAVNSAIDELIPSRWRGQTDLAINGSWWLGTLAGALISIPLLDPLLFGPDIGWRLAFALGSVLGLAILFVRRWVPESPRWLAVHGRIKEAEELVSEIERSAGKQKEARAEEHTEAKICFTGRPEPTLFTTARTLFALYPRRTLLGLSLMITQAFLYNAIFFSFAMVLNRYYSVPKEEIGLFIIPFAVSNFCGPLLLGRFFDSIGRRFMISLSYGVSGFLLALTAAAFYGNFFSATGQTLAWSAVFFFASAGASSAYLTVSEIFPIEIRAMAIAFFFVVAQGAASFTPWLFGALIEESRAGLASGYLMASLLMLFGAYTARRFGVDAERRSLEEIATPLSCSE